jgi:hypothetical protein
MKHGKFIAVVAVSGVVVILGAILIGQLFIVSNEQRRASCEAHLVALKAISSTNTAGLRVVAPIPPNLDEALVESFRLQQAQTIESNNKRLKVIKNVNVEILKLNNSDFCR